MKIFGKAINFLRQVKAELAKVSWSNREELFGSTMVVIAITSIITLFIGGIDLFLTKMLSLVFR